MMHERRGILSKMFHGVWQTVDASRKIAVNLLFVAIVIVLLAVAFWDHLIRLVFLGSHGIRADLVDQSHAE